MKFQFIEPSVHAVVDYALAATLLLAPFVPGLFEGSATAFRLSLGAGAALLVYSLITGYSGRARKLISYRAHLVLDFLAALMMLAAPVLLGFGGGPRAFFSILGAGVVAVVAVSRPDASEVTPGGVESRPKTVA